jgi:exopolysaccharide production protein ExoQ
MPPIVATLICVIGIAGLFYLNRYDGPRASKALWIPAIWLFIISSRPVSFWLNVSPSYAGNATAAYEEGSPVEQVVLTTLMVAALAVLFTRADRTVSLLRKNGLLTAYFLFCLVSISWSDFPVVAFKRWNKSAIGDVSMILVILTDARPLAALRRVFSRVGFLLFPLSELVIRYYPQIGRRPTNSYTLEPVGLADQKNSLGLDCLIYGVFFLWMFLSIYRERDDPSRRRRLFVYGTIIAIIVNLLSLCNSTTSIVGFACSAAVVWVAMRPWQKPAVVHLAVLTVLGISTFAIFGKTDMVETLGKSSTLSGRTVVWDLVLSRHTNPWIGTGFESFWLGPRLEFMFHALENLPINEAHNGYLEVYVNLGWAGVCFIVALILAAYRRVILRWRQNPRTASLILGFLLCTLFNAYTENAFRIMNPAWVIFLLVTIATSQPDLFRSAAVTEPAQISDIASHERTAYTPEGASPVRYQIAE